MQSTVFSLGFLCFAMMSASLLGEDSVQILPEQDQPTPVQLTRSDIARIYYTCYRDQDMSAVDMERWIKIATMVNGLIDKCYGTEYSVSDTQEDLLLEEVFATIRSIHQELRGNPAGLHGMLHVAVESKKNPKVHV